MVVHDPLDLPGPHRRSENFELALLHDLFENSGYSVPLEQRNFDNPLD